MQGGQVAVVMQLAETFLDKLDLLTFVDFYDRLVVDLVLNLLDSVLIGKGLLLDPVRVVGDKRRNYEAEGEHDVLNDEDSNNELGPCPVAIWAEPGELFRCEDDKKRRVDYAKGRDELKVFKPVTDVHGAERLAPLQEHLDRILLCLVLDHVAQDGDQGRGWEGGWEQHNPTKLNDQLSEVLGARLGHLTHHCLLFSLKMLLPQLELLVVFRVFAAMWLEFISVFLELAGVLAMWAARLD